MIDVYNESTVSACQLYSNGIERYRFPKATLSIDNVDDAATRVTKLVAYLAAEYAAGHPLTIVYQLATPTTLALNPYPAPLYAAPQLDMITPRQNVLTASSGTGMEVTYAKSPIQQANEVEAAIALLS
jgi:hypothetical protein